MSNAFRFRDYQLGAISAIFQQFGIQPAGPESDQIVAHCGSNRIGQNCDHGRAGKVVADRSSDDDQSPIRVEHPGDTLFENGHELGVFEILGEHGFFKVLNEPIGRVDEHFEYFAVDFLAVKYVDGGDGRLFWKELARTVRRRLVRQ